MNYIQLKIKENTIANNKVVYVGDIIKVDDEQAYKLLNTKKAEVFNEDVEPVEVLITKQSFLEQTEQTKEITKRMQKRGK